MIALLTVFRVIYFTSRVLCKHNSLTLGCKFLGLNYGAGFLVIMEELG
jgi:hypothetical protein